MVKSLMAASLLAAAQAQSFPPRTECGEVYAKDASHDAVAVAACQACEGKNAVLIYDGGLLDNIGMTYCAAQLSSPIHEDCGQAIMKDTSHDTDAIAACKACKGENAVLIWDASMADGLGYSFCAASLSSSLDCGEAIGKDNSHDAGAIAACKSCKGEKAFIDWRPYDADSTGYSYCRAEAQLSTPPDCGEAYAKDASHDAAAIAACKACKGKSAVLIYDGGMLDSIGMTYCAAQLSSPIYEDCGQAIMKDTSHDADAMVACKACKGENAVLIWDASMADGLGYSYCAASLSSSLNCGEAIGKDNSHDAGAIAACKACKGEKAFIDWQPYDADSTGYSYCRAEAQLSTPPDCGEAYAKDASHDAGAIAACKACKGEDAVLIYDGGMLDSIGMTYCQAAHTADFTV